MAFDQRTPLSQIDGWPDELVQKLARNGIYEAEQVFAIAQTPGGLNSLASEMGVTTDEADQLVGRARAQLSPETVAQLEQPVPRHGLGALNPEIQGTEVNE